MLSIFKSLHSKDRLVTKYIWELEDGNTIESTYIKFKNRDYDSLCISSQAGCQLRCAFCATRLDGFLRNLTTNEIIAQVEGLRRDIYPKRNLQVSFTGMGEPLLNFDAVVNALTHLKSKYPKMRFSLSTVGIVPKLYKLAEHVSDIQLRVSLHAPNDTLRHQLMPIAKKYPIKEVIRAATSYATATGATIIFNYLLLSGVNDSDAHANELVNVLKGVPAHLRISKFSHVYEADFDVASNKRHKAFEAICTQAGISTYQFDSLGTDIGAGMGQLRFHPSVMLHPSYFVPRGDVWWNGITMKRLQPSTFSRVAIGKPMKVCRAT